MEERLNQIEERLAKIEKLLIIMSKNVASTYVHSVHRDLDPIRHAVRMCKTPDEVKELNEAWAELKEKYVEDSDEVVERIVYKTI